MSGREAKNSLFDAFAEVAKALGSGRRAEIVDVLAQGQRSVEELAGEIEQSVANTSHHLQALMRAGLLTTRRDGTRVFYALASDRVGDLSGLTEIRRLRIQTFSDGCVSTAVIRMARSAMVGKVCHRF